MDLAEKSSKTIGSLKAVGMLEMNKEWFELFGMMAVVQVQANIIGADPISMIGFETKKF